MCLGRPADKVAIFATGRGLMEVWAGINVLVMTDRRSVVGIKVS